VTASSGKSGVTLQINVCAGDLEYCGLTVPRLVETHRRDVAEVVVVADCCRPQGTPYVHRASRFPSREFESKVARLRLVVSAWRREGLVDRVEYVEAVPRALRKLNGKYCGTPTAWSHDHLGHALSAYFAGWDCARTRYLLHLDADVLLYQASGFSWVRAAIERIEADPRTIAASPRIAPPLDDNGRMVNIDSPGSGWAPTWALDPAPGGWRSSWTSTRCHLMDLERLKGLLPLASGRGFDHGLNVLIAPAYRSALWSHPIASRGIGRLAHRAGRRLARAIPPFPLPPEVLLHERILSKCMNSFYIDDARAWYIHPDTKPPEFLSLLPDLLARVGKGQCPESQRGVSGIRFDAWDAYLSPSTDATGGADRP